MKKNLIEVKNLEKYFEVSGGFLSRKKTIVKAVDNISFEIPFGESLGLSWSKWLWKNYNCKSTLFIRS